MSKVYINNIEKEIVFDEENKQLVINKLNLEINYKEILDSELIEKKGTYGKSGIARAFSSSFLDDQNYVSTSLCINITTAHETHSFELIKTPLKSNTFIYKNIYKSAEYISKKIISINKQSFVSSRSYDYIDELRELKKLLDENILTQEEFDQKKSEILNKQ